jgi:hypothetical protein
MVAINVLVAMVVPMVRFGDVCVWRESGFGRREDVFIFNLIYKGIL